MKENEVEKIEVTTRTLAQLFGVTARRIQQLSEDGVLPFRLVRNRRTYNLVESVQKYTKFLKDGEKTADQQDLEAKLKKQKLEAEIALKESQAELHEMKTRLFDGQIIEVDDVKDDYIAFFKVFKRLVNGIAPRVAGQLSGQVDAMTVRKIEHDINDDLNECMETFVVQGMSSKEAEHYAKEKIR
jgi:phage terminase Nu1 subunit (DNA packaging protein)